MRSRAGRRSSPNTKYKIPRWNLGEFLNRPQASGHSDPLTASVACRRIQSPKCRVARPQGSFLTTRVAPCPGNLHLSKIYLVFPTGFFSLQKLADDAFYRSKLTRKLLLLTLDWRRYFSRDKSWEWGGGVRLFCPFPQNLRLTPRVLYDVFGPSSG